MKKSDLILLCSVLLAALAIFGICAAFTLGRGETVVVRVDGEEYARLPLGEDTELLIEGVNGGTNLLIIKDCEAYISEATCPDLVCVHTGSADELKSIVCLPNRVTVSIEK